MFSPVVGDTTIFPTIFGNPWLSRYFTARLCFNASTRACRFFFGSKSRCVPTIRTSEKGARACRERGDESVSILKMCVHAMDNSKMFHDHFSQVAPTNRWYLFILLGREWHKNTTQWPRSGLEPRPFDPESCAWGNYVWNNVISKEIIRGIDSVRPQNLNPKDHLYVKKPAP